MAVVTRGIAIPNTAAATASAAKAPAKASSRAKTSSRSKANKSRTAKRTEKPTAAVAPATPAVAPAAPAAMEVPETSSPGTVTPDVIEETDGESRDDHALISRLIRREIARTRDTQLNTRPSRADAYRVRKSRSHKHRHHSRRYSYSSGASTDSEEGYRPPVSFLHHKEGTRPFFDLCNRFASVHMKYFKQIFYGTFQPESLTKLGQSMSDRDTTEAPQDAKGMAHMLLCMEIYGQIVLHFSNSAILGPLQEALSKYRVRLIEMSVIYKFDSIKAYNATFIRTRILLGQDDPQAWAREDGHCRDLLMRKLAPSEISKPPTNSTFKSSSLGQGIYRNFNKEECAREYYKYSYSCLNCQQPGHPASACERPQTMTSAANIIPLRNRVSRPE